MPPAVFDADTFLAIEITQELATRFIPLPEDDYAPAFIDDTIVVREYEGTPVVDVSWVIQDEKAQKLFGRDRVTVKHRSMFIELDEKGHIVFGQNKNVALGALRDALGQNTGKPWNFHMLKGQGPCKVHVIVRPDKHDSTIKYNEVTRVARIR